MTIGTDKLPQGWKWAKLGDVCMVNPRRPTGFDWDPHTKVTFVPMPSVDGQTGTITQPQERMFAEVSRGYTYFEEGDVLFAKITPCMQNGKHAIASGLGNGFGFGSTEFHVLRPSGAVLSEWVHKFLRQPSVLAEAVHHFRGSVGQQRVPKEYLHSLQIPLPPLGEQKRIASLLHQQMAYVEKARKAAEEMLELAHALPGAFLRQAFPAHGDALPAGWKWVQLGDVCELKYGFSLPARKRIEGPYKVYGSNGQVGTHAEARTSGPVIVVGRKGSVGKIHLVGEPCWPIDTTYFIDEQLISADLEWLHFVLKRFQLGRLEKSSVIPGLNRNDVYKQQIPLPPLSEQQRIAALLKEQMAYVQTICVSAREQLDAIHALPAALLRMAFAGNL